MRVLVTGGAGFIGSHIVDALLLRGHEVAVLDDLSSGRNYEGVEGRDRIIFSTDAVQGYLGSVTDTYMLNDIVADFRPCVICHQAAQPSLRRSMDDPAHDATINIIGTLNVIQAAKACGAHVVFASTSAVYDPAGGTFAEDSPIVPNLPYGIAKATAERYLMASGICYTILRYGNVYGPRQVQVGENQLIPHCLAHLLDGRPFQINGDGWQSRDFVYVADIARANVLAIEGKVRGIFNIGTGKSRSVWAVCEALRQFSGQAAEDVNEQGGTFTHGPAKAGEARHVTLDSSKARTRLGWQAETNWADSLKQTIAWWKEHRCVSV